MPELRLPGRCLFLVLFFIATLGVSTTAFAETDIERFEAHIVRAANLLEFQDFAGAIAELEKAQEIIDHPRVAMRIADAYLDWQRCGEAQSLYETLLTREDIDSELRSRNSERLRRAQEECTEHAAVRILCAPANATLLLDGEELACPFDGDLPTGEHQLELHADGHQPHSESLSVQAQTTTERAIALAALSTDPPPQPKPPTNVGRIAGFSTLGLGVVALGLGGMVDYGASSRTGELAMARDARDARAIEELEAQANQARITTISLYSAGAALLIGGTLLTVFSTAPEADQPGLSASLTANGVVTTFRW